MIVQFLSESRALSRLNGGQNFFFRSSGRGCKWVYKGNISVRGVVRRTAVAAIAIIVIVVDVYVANSSFPRAALIIKFPRVVRQRVDRFLNFPSQGRITSYPLALPFFPFTLSFSFHRFFSYCLLLFAYYPRLDSRYNHWRRRSSGVSPPPRPREKLIKLRNKVSWMA